MSILQPREKEKSKGGPSPTKNKERGEEILSPSERKKKEEGT